MRSNEFHNRLRYLREYREMTSAEMARHTGLSKAQYCNYEMGKHTPNIEIAHRIAKTLNVPLAFLFEGELPKQKTPEWVREECVLGKKNVNDSAAYRCGIDCKRCGWNAYVAAQRKQAIREGRMVCDDRGLQTLRVGRMGVR